VTADSDKLREYLELPYRVELRFDKETDRWFVSFPELPGCDADGATREEALTRGDEVKALWLETAMERGSRLPLPEPEPSYSGRLMLRLSRTLHERVARLANREGVSLNSFLVQLVTQGVERFGVMRGLVGVIEGRVRRVVRDAVLQTGPGTYQVMFGIMMKRIDQSEPVIPVDTRPITGGAASASSNAD